MTLRKWFYLFWTTMALGAVGAVVVGALLNGVTGSLGLDIKKQLFAGLMFAAVAELGFFAYLMFNWLGNGFFRNPFWFRLVQVLLMILVLVDLAYLRIVKFGTIGGIWPQLGLPISVLILAWIVACVKVRMTNRTAFVPTLFFMVVATAMEAGPSLKQAPLVMVFFMVLTLMVCNAWQILQLHRLVAPDRKTERKGLRTVNSREDAQ
ncbi:KinB-signaling pathway activation protein [Polycladomyces sp. WAk]|uniref:KinB-signaling pathway activation protein n=1 Tax=Polycladomyces zharkentensis TaxID=2807616 RepID=A0ABS2WJ37_9BACL|nr:KinB-signaling pathway activation protein [Polycladomyces sp. WAk]MBN2909315.1 KinB-signaling pathway activation protein [Polycladomyces sp. WAk]